MPSQRIFQMYKFMDFGQNVWHSNYLSIYSSDADFAHHIKLLTPLAYVPLDRTEDAFEKLMAINFYSEHST